MPRGATPRADVIYFGISEALDGCHAISVVTPLS